MANTPRYTAPFVGQRVGSSTVTHTFPFSYNTTGIGSGIKVGTIVASASNPVQVEVSYQVVTAFNGTNNTVGIGTTATANEWVTTTATGASLTTGYYPASNNVGKYRLTATTDVYVTYTKTGTPSTGSAVAIIRCIDENPGAIA